MTTLGQAQECGGLDIDADVIVVGAGLAGLVAAAEAAEAGRRVLLLDQEPEQSLGGQAWWSFGGLFFVNSPEQRRLRIRDSVDLAWQDWIGTAGFDRPEDDLAAAVGARLRGVGRDREAVLAAAMGHRVVPVVGWAERGGYQRHRPRQLGAAIPHHLGHRAGGGRAVRTAGAGRGRAGGRLEFRFRHRVDALTVTNGVVDGVAGTVLEPSDVAARHAQLADPGRRVRTARRRR